jgi:hypothetical protein
MNVIPGGRAGVRGPAPREYTPRFVDIIRGWQEVHFGCMGDTLGPSRMALSTPCNRTIIIRPGPGEHVLAKLYEPVRGAALVKTQDYLETKTRD